jgi:hypothetical protein
MARRTGGILFPNLRKALNAVRQLPGFLKFIIHTLKSSIKLLFPILAFIVGIAIFLFYQFVSIPSKIQDELTAQYCTGVIDTIKKEQPCFLTIRVRQMTETIGLSVMNCCDSEKTDFFKAAHVGDSLIKKKGEFTLLLINAKTHETKEFPYPYCFQ